MVLAAATPVPAAPAVRIVVDDVPVALTPAPAVLGGILYLPLRPLASQFGSQVTAGGHTITVTLTDGTVLTLHPDRMEVWSGALVWALLEAPVRLLDGVTFVPASAVDPLFHGLTQWDQTGQTLYITTRAVFHADVAARPMPSPTPSAVTAAPPPFKPEFVPDTGVPLVTSGYVSVGGTIGGQAGTTAAAQASFSTHEGTERVNGSVAVAAANGAIQATGTVTVRSPLTVLTVGALTLDDSPLTLYQQAMTGVSYENMSGPGDATYFGGELNTSGVGSAYGMKLRWPQSGPWAWDGVLLYAPVTGAMVVKTRVEHPVGDALTAFGEVGAGMSAGLFGFGWRTGLTGVSGTLSTSLSYLSLASDYPAIGNAAVFAGRSGPLLQLSYRPTPVWSILASAAALTAAGLPERTTYSLLADYRPSAPFGVISEVRTTEDVSAGVHTRATSGQVAVSWSAGRWGVVAGLSAVDDADLMAQTSSLTSTWSLRAGYTLNTGRPVWAELSRSTGATESWNTAVGWTFPTAWSFDLTTALRYKAYANPASTETAVELGIVQPLPTGAQLLIGAGVKYTTPDAATTSYLTFQYGYPFYQYGTPQVGQISGFVFADTNGNGVRDPDDPGVAGVTVRIDGRSAAQTDATGHATVTGAHEGQYVVSVDDATVPAGLVAARPEVEVVVAAGGTSDVTFALVRSATVRGMVFIDENGDGQLTMGEQGVEGVLVTLQPAGFRTSDSLGTFEFAQLLPGEYAVVVDQDSLPPDLKVGNNGIYPLTVQPGGTAVVWVPLVSTKPVIKKTFP